MRFCRHRIARCGEVSRVTRDPGPLLVGAPTCETLNPWSKCLVSPYEWLRQVLSAHVDVDGKTFPRHRFSFLGNYDPEKKESFLLTCKKMNGDTIGLLRAVVLNAEVRLGLEMPCRWLLPISLIKA